MQNLAATTQMVFFDTFGTDYFFAYLPYSDALDSSPPAVVQSRRTRPSS